MAPATYRLAREYQGTTSAHCRCARP